jgi:hypothetical protein
MQYRSIAEVLTLCGVDIDIALGVGSLQVIVQA